MRRPLLLTSLSLAVLLSASVLAQDPVEIQFLIDPVLVQTGTEIVFTALTVPQVLTMTWQYEGLALGVWVGGNSVIEPVPQFQGRVTITASQLRIGGAQRVDSGTYTVQVTPIATTGLGRNSRSIQLSVFDAVTAVSLVIPTIVVEDRNVTLRCTWTGGTNATVQWGKGGAAITPDSRITISGAVLIINPARRSDAGEYTCTASNPVSAQTATRSLTVYYGPDAPVLTKDTPEECVGGGDVLAGQTVRLTCMSDSLPPALFTWRFDGQTVASDQPDSGVLSLQTFSSDESGRYVCTARNAITGGTSDQGTVLAIVDTCLNAGEVAGIVIGCLLLIIIIVLLIWLVIFLVQRRRAERRQLDTMYVQRTKPNPRPTPPDPRPNDARALEQLANPPLYPLNTRIQQPDRLYAAPHENRGNPQTLQLNGLHDSNTRLPNGHTNMLPHNSIRDTSAQPHNGVDNPAFTHTDAQNANTAPNTPQQNPNILIQAGPAERGVQPPAVHFTLNALPQTAQQNSNAQIPTIHVNLNSYPTNGQRTQQDSSFPLSNTANNNFLQTQQGLTHAGPSDPRMQSGPPYPSDPRLNGHLDTVHQGQPDLIPTGYTHVNRNSTSQRNANTQTYEQEPEPRTRSDRTSGRHDTSASSSRRQMPWDRLRGTPAYPGGTRQGGPGFTSDTTDYTTNPPIREERAPNRSQARPQSQTASWSRAPPKQDAPPVDGRAQSGSSDHRIRNVTQLQVTHHNQRSPHIQGRNAQQDIGGLSGSQTALRQETTHSSNPHAAPLMSQQGSQGPVTQQGPTASQGADTRALVDPNHLPQAYTTQQVRAAPIQRPPQGLGTQTQPVIPEANQRRQGGAAPVAHSAAQPLSNNLTHDALKAHTERAQTFQDRKQQTQAALLHPGPQAQAPAVGAQHRPTPPPVIPLAQFQTLPKNSTQHKSPTRGPQPPRPPVNMPVAQRPQQVRHRPNVQQHPVTMPVNHHHHHHGNGHMHVNAPRHAMGRGRGQGHPAHFTHPRQPQANRGRPR